VAASLALLVLATVALLNINRLPTNEKLFAQNFAPFDNSGQSTKRGDSANGDELLNRALSLYDNEQYDEALVLFNQLNEQDPENALNLLYTANIFMSSDQFDEAIVYLKKIEEMDKGVKSITNWYLGLCFVKKGETEEAKKYLELVANSKSYYSPKAKKILDKL
jgi:tetratricopeptide (TPR) repeat protein